MKKPVDEWTHENGKSIRKYSYVATLCEKNGFHTKAVRVEFYTNKYDAHKVVAEAYPGWNIKNINRLYDEDFA